MASTSPWVNVDKRMLRAGLEAVADSGFSGSIEWRIYGFVGLHPSICEVLKQAENVPDPRAREVLESFWGRIERWIEAPRGVTLKLFFAGGAITRAEKNSVAMNAEH